MRWRRHRGALAMPPRTRPHAVRAPTSRSTGGAPRAAPPPAEPLPGALGLRIERDGQLFAGWRTAAQPLLILPLGSCVVQFTSPATGAPTPLDRAAMALVPRGARYRLRSHGAVTDVLTLFIGAPACARVEREYAPHVRADIMAQVLATGRLLPRTRWVDELAQRYLFERNVCFKHDSHAAVFLETELTKELYFLGAELAAGGARTSGVFEGSDVFTRARDWIEHHLFERVSVPELARVAHASEATLLRTFLRQLGVTPAAYQRGRRLEEAVLLLRAGRHTVGEIAERVGYRSLPAFTVAFRRQFGIAPSRVVASVPAGAFLPAHGAPLATLPTAPTASTEPTAPSQGARPAPVRGSHKQLTVSRNGRRARPR